MEIDFESLFDNASQIPQLCDKLATEFPREYVNMIDPSTGRASQGSLRNYAERYRVPVAAATKESLCAEILTELRYRKRNPVRLAGRKRSREGYLLESLPNKRRNK